MAPASSTVPISHTTRYNVPGTSTCIMATDFPCVSDDYGISPSTSELAEAFIQFLIHSPYENCYEVTTPKEKVPG